MGITQTTPRIPDPMQPYTPPPDVNANLPPITPPPQRDPNSIQQQPGPAVLPGSKGSGMARVAYGLDSILKGYMRGRDYAQQQQAYKANRLIQGLQFNYQNAAQQYIGYAQQNPEAVSKMFELDKLQSSKNPSPDEQKKILELSSDKDVQQAQQYRDGSAAARAKMMEMYGNYINPQKKTKGSKSKGGDQSQGPGGDGQNPLLMAQSQDPKEKARGLWMLGVKMGDPANIQVRQFASPEYITQRKQRQTQQQLTSGEQQLEGQKQKKELRMNELMAKTKRTADEDNELRELRNDPLLFPAMAKPSAPKFSPIDIPGASLKDKIDPTTQRPFLDAYGNDIDDKLNYREEDLGGGEKRYIPHAAPAAKMGSLDEVMRQYMKENNLTELTADQQMQIKRAYGAPGGTTSVHNGQVMWTDNSGNTWKIPITSTTTRTNPAMPLPKPKPPTWAPGATLEGGTPTSVPAAGHTAAGHTAAKPAAAPTKTPAATPAATAATATLTPTPPVKGAEFIGKKNLDPEEKLQNALRARDHNAAKKIVDTAKADYDGALVRMDTMDKNLKAALNGDQQAMLSLVANHIGMTLGAQKGARITRAVWEEAIRTAPWIKVQTAKWFHEDPATGDMVFDGYKTGVTLAPEQMHSMVKLAHEKVDTLKKNIPVLEKLYADDLAATGSAGTAGSGKATPAGPHAVDSILDEKFGKPSQSSQSSPPQ